MNAPRIDVKPVNLILFGSILGLDTFSYTIMLFYG